MHERIICAGFGGQGVMLLGKLLTQAGMRSGRHVTWMPSYGAEVRGGTAHSMIHISDSEISSPIVSNPTTCIVMNKPSLLKFMDRVERGGLLIINTSMAEDIVEKRATRIAAFPLTKLALELGNIKVANMIAAGAFVRLKGIFSLQDVLEELSNVLPSKKDLVAINKKAVKLGYELIK